jgi:hypothetical protein
VKSASTSAAAAEATEYRLSVQIAWNMLTDLKVAMPAQGSETPQVLSGISLVARVH